MRMLMVCCCFVILTACKSSLSHHVYDFGDELELQLGEKVAIGAEKVSVKFTDVLEDSRCPSNVTCVWAGNGKVQLRFNYNVIQLNTYLEPHKVVLEEFEVQLLSLEPYPKHPRQFEKEDYKVRLLITKK